MGSSKKWLKIIVSKKRSSRVTTISSESSSAKEKPSRWTLWKSLHVTATKIGVVVSGGGLGAARSSISDAVREERAAIRIQTAFRGFLARRAVRALKGLVRLQAAISGHGAHKQSAASLHCIQAFVRVQARIHTQRAVKNREALGVPQKLASHTVGTCTTDSEAEWCNTIGTVQEIQAKVQQRQEAAIKRERAIAYAFSNKWRANSKLNSESVFDHELDNSTWSWIWLDRWINGQPDESHTSNQSSKQVPQTVARERKKLVFKKPASRSVKKYVNSKVFLDTSKDNHKPLARARSPGGSLHTKKVSDVKEKLVKTRLLHPDAELSPGQHKRRSLSQSKQQLSKDVKRKPQAL